MALGSNIIKSKSQKDPSQEDDVEKVEKKYEGELEEEDFEEDSLEVQEEKTMLVVFPVGNVSYAVSIELVKEIVPMPSVVSMPQVGSHILGATNIRGNVLTVVDLDLIEEDKLQGTSKEYKYAVVIRDEEYKVALAVTAMPKTISVLESEFEDASTIAAQNIVEEAHAKHIVKKDSEFILVADIVEIIKRK